MHRGEVNGVCPLDASSIKSQFSDDVTSGRLKLVIQMGAKKSEEFGPIPSVFDCAKTDEERAVLEVLFVRSRGRREFPLTGCRHCARPSRPP
jgi:hypothetical protein